MAEKIHSIPTSHVLPLWSLLYLLVNFAGYVLGCFFSPPFSLSLLIALLSFLSPSASLSKLLDLQLLLLIFVETSHCRILYPSLSLSANTLVTASVIPLSIFLHAGLRVVLMVEPPISGFWCIFFKFLIFEENRARLRSGSRFLNHGTTSH